jgi:hypothetical protein
MTNRKKAIKVLQELKPTEKYYKQKVKLLAELINYPSAGNLCPDNLVLWCDKVGLKTEYHCEDKTSFWTFSGR